MDDQLLQRARQRHRELEHQLQNIDVAHERERYAQLARAYADLAAALKQWDELRAVDRARREAQETLSSGAEEDLKQFARTELQSLTDRASQLTASIREIIDPPDPRDRKDVIIEIRSGAGGEEAALFAAELFRIYLRYAERRRWKTMLVNESRTSLGGIREVIFELTGGPIFKALKFESGVHRVQRVPSTEKSGRVHTSTATVVVLPEDDEVEVKINPNDLEITATTSSGHGGQSVNTTYSAIRIVHKPTGIIVTCQDERSQLQNKEKALRVLRARLLAFQEQRRAQEASATRKSLIGSGDRSEKIRTYNFPQDRITDHRLKESFHGISRIMDGDLDPLIQKLQATQEMLATR